MSYWKTYLTGEQVKPEVMSYRRACFAGGYVLQVDNFTVWHILYDVSYRDIFLMNTGITGGLCLVVGLFSIKGMS